MTNRDWLLLLNKYVLRHKNAICDNTPFISSKVYDCEGLIDFIINKGVLDQETKDTYKFIFSHLERIREDKIIHNEDSYHLILHLLHDLVGADYIPDNAELFGETYTEIYNQYFS